MLPSEHLERVIHAIPDKSGSWFEGLKAAMTVKKMVYSLEAGIEVPLNAENEYPSPEDIVTTVYGSNKFQLRLLCGGGKLAGVFFGYDEENPEHFLFIHCWVNNGHVGVRVISDTVELPSLIYSIVS